MQEHDAPVLMDFEPEDSFRGEMLRSLRQSPKWIHCKFLYDEPGSRFFDRITELPEYYPTRTELGIMERYTVQMAEAIGPDALLIEYGSGSSTKTHLLLDALERPAGYVPIDIAREHLVQAAQRLQEHYPGLGVYPVCADYTAPFDLPDVPARRNVVYFPGSTIGNFEPAYARRFLEGIRMVCGSEGGLLIGVDLKKDPLVLHAAYNDAEGVTAAFNKNILLRLNRELEATFDPERFRHYAFYDPQAGRVEMHLVALEKQEAFVTGERFVFEKGESIWTESSYKYTPDGFSTLAGEAGFAVRQVWTDEKAWFSVQYLEPR